MSFEPVEETRLVFEGLAEAGDPSAEAALTEIGKLVQALVPECVGLSLALMDQGLTLTLVASTAEVASLDAVQYLDGGPCVDAAEQGTVISTTSEDVLDEDTWQLYAQATAAAGIASSLSLPLIVGGETIGTVNLYASTADAFEDHVDELAAGLGACAADAVMNADLDFLSRRRAARGPSDLADLDHINQAVGMISVALQVDLASARKRLDDAAVRAGIPPGVTARALIGFLSSAD
jgi:GAF domain-containing protein